MEIRINIEKRHFFVLLLAVFVLGGILIVNAYNTNSPSVFGHTPGEINPGVFGGDGTSDWRFPGNVGIGNKDPKYNLHVVNDGLTNLGLDMASNDAASAYISGLKKRGTQQTPAAIQGGDNLLLIRAYGYSGPTSLVTESASIYFDTEGTIADGTVTGKGRVPGMIKFLTRPNMAPDDPSNILNERMRISANGEVKVSKDFKVDGKLNLAGAISVYKCPVHGPAAGRCVSGCNGQLVTDSSQTCSYPTRYNSEVGACEITSATCNIPVGKLIPN